MPPRIAEESLHLRDWLAKASVIAGSGRGEYDRNELLQKAGDSLMMKIGEAAKAKPLDPDDDSVGPTGACWGARAR